LPRPKDFRAPAVIRHEQHAESVLFAYATFGSPPYPTFYNADGYNYPNLTPEMVRRNKSNVPAHAPAHALGHGEGPRQRQMGKAWGE
jgi:hypothetical protein